MIDEKNCILTGKAVKKNIQSSFDGSHYIVEHNNKEVEIKFARRMKPALQDYVKTNPKSQDIILWLMENGYWKENDSLSPEIISDFMNSAMENESFRKLITA